jgi:hypothetical protein
MNLAQWQQSFRGWLVTGSGENGCDFGERAAPGLEVYQNNYRTQLVNCLQVSYPHLLRWIGDEAFRQVAIRHIDAHPPYGWTLDSYGKDFGTTLQEIHPRNPDLLELAWIEWALSEAFVAMDAAPMSKEALGSVNWDEARLRLTPSLRHHVATTNADEVWSALLEESGAVPDGEMLDAPGGLVVWRRGFLSRLRRFDVHDYAALLGLLADSRFEAMCEKLVARLGEEPGVTRAGTLLAEWIDAGLIVGVTED